MQIKDVYDYFNTFHLQYLKIPEAIAYLAFVVRDEEFYASGIKKKLNEEYPKLAISDTVLYQAIDCLSKWQWINHYNLVQQNRGRPRTMYRLDDQYLEEVKNIACLWEYNYHKQYQLTTL